jgi:hypothetical protein
MQRVGILFSLGLVLLFASRSEAKVFVVTDTADTTDIHSLRGAVIFANRLGGHNTILLRGPSRPEKHFQPIYYLTISGPKEDHSRTGDLDITGGDLTIIGSSPGATIDAAELGDRVFQVFPKAHLTLFRLAIKGGRAPASGFFAPEIGNGGAICNSGSLNLQECILTDNASGGGSYVEGNGGGTGGEDGGAVYNSGKVSMSDCLIQENFCGDGFDGAYGGSGGGIENNGACVLIRCFISGNRSGSGGSPSGNAFNFGGNGGNGGGIFNSGAMTLTKCVIDGNLTGYGVGGVGGGGNGAGIYNAGRMLVDYSSIFGNTNGSGGNGSSGDSSSLGGIPGPGGSGAGIFNAGKLDLNMSTISSNFCGIGGAGGPLRGGGADGGAGGSGGGVYNAGSLHLTSCTIVLNRTAQGGDGGNGYSFLDINLVANGGQGGGGGGIFNQGTNTIIARNTLIAVNTISQGGQGGTTVFIPFGPVLIPSPPPSPTNELGNAGADGVGPDIAGDFISEGFNLIGAADGGFGFASEGSGDLAGTVASPIDPLIGPLQMNGGPTPTHALLPGSPAIDQGKSFNNHNDQRGERRPFDYSTIPDATGGDGSDIGAFELRPRQNGRN